MSGANVVIDVSNSPSYEPQAVLEFFETSTRNLIEAGRAAGVRHHVVLSIVGAGRVPGQAYYRAKVAQEKLVAASDVPYTIVRRLEEHTSELQSLMRISYAVFCLKKKKQSTTDKH